VRVVPREQYGREQGPGRHAGIHQGRVGQHFDSRAQHRRDQRFNVSDEERRRLADAESRPAQEPDDDRLDVRRGALEDGVVLVPAEPVDRLLKATWEA